MGNMGHHAGRGELTDEVHANRRQTVLAVIILVIATLLFYAKLWLPGLVLIKRDAYRHWLPIKHYMIERLSAGELPEWFPYEAMGRPFIGIASTGVFHPFTSLYFWLSTSDAYRASVLISCVVAALGAFMLARMLRVSRSGAVLSGLALACSGYVASLTDNLLYLYAVCILPVFCAALECARVKSLAWVVAPAVVWATVFLNGDGQNGYYFGFIALLWMLGPPNCFRMAAARVLLIGILCALLAGIQLGPSLAVFVHSERTQASSFHEQAVHWSTHPLRLVAIMASPVGEREHAGDIAHYFFGSRSGSSLPTGFWAESLYLGLPVVGLALLGGWYRRELWRFVLLGAGALLLALGAWGGLYDVFYHVMPFWSAFRYPEKLMGVATFAIAMLAGAGFDELRTGRGHEVLWLGAAVVFAIAGGSAHALPVSAWTERLFGAPSALAQEVASSLSWALLFSAALGFATWLVAVAVRRQRLNNTALAGLLLVACVLDLSRVNQGAYHVALVETATFAPPFAEAIRRDAGVAGPGHFRILTIKDPEVVFPSQLKESLDLLSIGSVVRRQSLDVDLNAEFHLESVKASLPGHSVGLAALAALADKRLGAQVYGRYNVGYFIGRSRNFEDPHYARARVATLGAYDLALVRNPFPVKPRAYVSRQPERSDAPVELEQLISRPEFLEGEMDVIEAPDGVLPGSSSRGEGTVVMERYLPENVQVQVVAPAPAVLVVLDAFDQGWQAVLENGDPLPILRANALSRAVVVPAGAHRVTFTYRTPFLQEGLVSSLIGICFCLALLVRARWRAPCVGEVCQ